MKTKWLTKVLYNILTNQKYSVILYLEMVNQLPQEVKGIHILQVLQITLYTDLSIMFCDWRYYYDR